MEDDCCDQFIPVFFSLVLVGETGLISAGWVADFSGQSLGCGCDPCVACGTRHHCFACGVCVYVSFRGGKGVNSIRYTDCTGIKLVNWRVELLRGVVLNKAQS